MKKPLISVIIPVFRDWDALGRALEALQRQTLDQHRFEVIAVKNDPADGRVRRFSNRNLRLIPETKRGSYAARNAGIAHSRGEILAFCDADCIPAPEWLEAAVHFFGIHSDCRRMAGRIRLFFSGVGKPRLAERYDKIFAFRQQDYAREGAAATANMFAHRSVFHAVGGFDETLVSGGDLEWGRRAARAGYAIGYSDRAWVWHPARRTVRELAAKTRRTCSGYIRLNRARFDEHPLRACYHGLSMLKPPVLAGAMIFRHRDVPVRDRVGIYLLEYFLKLIQFQEYARLQCGGRPRR